MAKKAKAKVNDKAFNLMTAVADKTNVDVLAKGKESSIKGIHNALLAAGMTPAYGNIADVADATLYALEGEFGEAAWSMAAAIPVIGQMVAGKRALKIAKEAGEEMVTVYRGIPEWFSKRENVGLGRSKRIRDLEWDSGGMVKEGKFVGGGGMKNWGKMPVKKTALFVTDNKKWAGSSRYTKRDWVDPYRKRGRGHVLEFEMPKSYFDKNVVEIVPKFGQKGLYPRHKRFLFQEGIPKEFLKKVHK